MLENNGRKWRLPKNHFLIWSTRSTLKHIIQNKWFGEHLKKPRNGKLSVPAHRPSSQKRKIHWVFKGIFAKLEFTGRRPRSDIGPKRRETRVHRHNCRSCKHAPKPLETKAETSKERIRTPSRAPNSLLLSEKRDQIPFLQHTYAVGSISSPYLGGFMVNKWSIFWGF